MTSATEQTTAWPARAGSHLVCVLLPRTDWEAIAYKELDVLRNSGLFWAFHLCRCDSSANSPESKRGRASVFPPPPMGVGSDPDHGNGFTASKKTHPAIFWLPLEQLTLGLCKLGALRRDAAWSALKQ